MVVVDYRGPCVTCWHSYHSAESLPVRRLTGAEASDGGMVWPAQDRMEADVAGVGGAGSLYVPRRRAERGDALVNKTRLANGSTREQDSASSSQLCRGRRIQRARTAG